MSIRLGTRGSALALAQSGRVADALTALLGSPVELVVIHTEGDVRTGPLAELGGTGVFAAAIRQALLDDRVDVAVHSLKDLPTAPHPGLEVAAVPPREDPRDALCARDGLTLTALPAGARVGTGSPRRAAQLRAHRPDLRVVGVRGNVGTRLDRVGPADLDAVVLARAGLARLGRLDAVTEVLSPDVVLPAPGQGALAVETRAEHRPAELSLAVAALDDPGSRAEVAAERAVLAELEAGCSAPVGALARVGAGRLELRARVSSPDGAGALDAHGSVQWDTDSGEGVAAGLGRSVAARLLGRGAADLARSSGGTRVEQGRTT